MLSMCDENPWFVLRTIRGEQMTAIEHLYNRLDGMYPKKFREQFTDDRSVKNWQSEWVEAFTDEKITMQQVAEALRACKTRYDWPPSLPEFLKLCRPSIAFDPETAFREAVEQLRKRDFGEDVWSHPAIFWSAVKFGAWDLRQANWQQAKNAWTKILAEKLADKNLEPVPPRALALPPPPPVSKEVAEKRLSELRQMLYGVTKKMVVNSEVQAS